MKKLIILLLLISSTSYAYNVDPTTRTHKTNSDIVWNILDILDDYINFDYLSENQEKKESMRRELGLYINGLNEIKINQIEGIVDDPIQ
jgi:hypothetical protein